MKVKFLQACSVNYKIFQAFSRNLDFSFISVYRFKGIHPLWPIDLSHFGTQFEFFDSKFSPILLMFTVQTVFPMEMSLKFGSWGILILLVAANFETRHRA